MRENDGRAGHQRQQIRNARESIESSEPRCQLYAQGQSKHLAVTTPVIATVSKWRGGGDAGKPRSTVFPKGHGERVEAGTLCQGVSRVVSTIEFVVFQTI